MHRYYSPEDRYGALLTLSYEQRSTLRAVFDKYAKRINNSFLLNSEYFPKFLEDMNAEESIPWKFLKGGKDDEFGDAVLLVRPSRSARPQRIADIMPPRRSYLSIRTRAGGDEQVHLLFSAD